MPPSNRKRTPRARGNEILLALQRQIGPLPAWAWALVGGVSLYFYRNRSGALTPASAPNPTTPTVDDASGKQDPVTLSPGEAAYDPNTGAILGNAPDQQPTPDPVTLDPGQAVWDPKTGKLVTNRKPKAKTPPKRAPKPKPQHNGGKPVGSGKKPVKHRKGARVQKFARDGKGSSVGSGLVKGLGIKRSTKPRALVPAATTTPTGAHKPAAAAAPAKPVMRQRTAAPAITHPAAQKVTKHPAKTAKKR